MASIVYKFVRNTARALFPRSIYERLKWWWWSRPKPDRRYMEQEILPELAKLHPHRVLFVGTQGYTAHYRRHFNVGAAAQTGACEYWTLDVDPKAAPFGAPGRHKTASVTEVDQHFEPAFFDIVLLNGVFGFGVNDPQLQAQTLVAIHQILQPGGILLLGWNNDLVTDPIAGNIAPRGYEHAAVGALPARKQFPQSTHIYDFLRKI
jgi:SAM-dependent methyltransferase